MIHDYSSVCQTRPFLEGHNHLNRRLGKIARFCPIFCDFACFFVIFVILNGIHYAQIEEINNKTRDINTSPIEQTTERYECPFFSPKVQSAPVLTFFYFGKYALFEEFYTLQLAPD